MLRKILPLLCLSFACGDDAKPPPAAAGGGCEAVVAKWQATCDDDEGYPLEVCEADEGGWLGAGCDKEWAAYTRCEAAGKPDCEEGGVLSCEPKLDALFACQSNFVRRTGCASEGYREECAKETPFAIYCLNGGPPDKACVKLDDGGGYCCP